MSALTNRSVRVIAGGIVIENLRVQFKVKRHAGKTPNECELSIYNLSADHRSSSVMQSKGTKVILEAGYEGTTSQVFSGDSSYISHEHKGADWITKVQCGDGERVYKYGTVSESFKAGTTVAQVFSRVVAGSGLDVADAVALVSDVVSEQFTHGYVAFGRLSRELDRLLLGRGLEWSIQDGKLQVLEVGASLRANAVLLSASTGLIGSPTYGSPAHNDKPAEGTAPKGQPKPKKQVLKAKSLLQPAIRPRGLIRLESLAIKGNFQVDTVEHTGDTHGQEWYSEADLIPVS